MPQTVNSRKCLGLSRSAPTSSAKLRSTAPAAAIFPRRREADGTQQGRASVVTSGRRGGRAGGEVRRGRGRPNPALRCPSRLAGVRCAGRGSRGERARGSLRTPPETFAWPAGTPQAAAPYSRRPRGGARPGLFPILKTPRGTQVSACREGEVRRPGRRAPSTGFPSLRSSLPSRGICQCISALSPFIHRP